MSFHLNIHSTRTLSQKRTELDAILFQESVFLVLFSRRLTLP